MQGCWPLSDWAGPFLLSVVQGKPQRFHGGLLGWEMASWPIRWSDKWSSANQTPMAHMRSQDPIGAAQLPLHVSLQELADSGEELGGWGAIDECVVEREAERHKRARHHGAGLIKAGHGA